MVCVFLLGLPVCLNLLRSLWGYRLNLDSKRLLIEKKRASKLIQIEITLDRLDDVAVGMFKKDVPCLYLIEKDSLHPIGLDLQKKELRELAEAIKGFLQGLSRNI